MKTIKITLKKSLNGRSLKQIRTAHSVGLRKIDDYTVQPKNDATEGKLCVIEHMVEVQEM